MSNRGQRRRSSHWVGFLGVLGVFALVSVSGCGGSARPDFDLNRGEVEVQSEVTAEIEALFAPEDSAATYRIAAGDRLEIVFFTHPEQNRFVRVRPDGRVSLPFIGDVDVAGREPEAVARELESRYAGVLVQPRVDVLVHEVGAQYYVLGEVLSPGAFRLDRRVDILQGIARAGGYRSTARLGNLVLLRKDGKGGAYAAILDLRSYLQDSERKQDLELRPDDIVWVPKDNLSRFDNVARKLFEGVVSAEDVVIRGWQMGNLDKVYDRRNF